MRTQLDGLLAFPLTPFDDRLELDVDALAEHLQRHIDAGAGALFVACGTGEFAALTAAEVRTVLRTALEVARGAVPVWVGAGGGPVDARDGVLAAEEAGADGVLLLPPYLVSGPQRGLLGYVRYALSGTEIPAVVYHRGTAVFTPESACALLDMDTVVGLKDGYGDVDLMSRIVTAVRGSGHRRAADFLFFNGLPTAEMSQRAYRAIGVHRYSSAVHCFLPELAHRFHRAVAAGDDATVDTLLARFYLPLVQLRDETPGFAVSLVKAGAVLRGEKVGGVRPPLVDPTEEQLTRLGRIVAAGEELLRG